MKYLLLFILLNLIACSKKDEVCNIHKLEYLDAQSEEYIANQASVDMTKECSGEYNIQNRIITEKRIIYEFTCVHKCN